VNLLRVECSSGFSWRARKAQKVREINPEVTSVVRGGERIPLMASNAVNLRRSISRVDCTRLATVHSSRVTILHRPQRANKRKAALRRCRAGRRSLTPVAASSLSALSSLAESSDQCCPGGLDAARPCAELRRTLTPSFLGEDGCRDRVSTLDCCSAKGASWKS
jgi:hypothetical protein